jgi:hypothetical protein
MTRMSLSSAFGHKMKNKEMADATGFEPIQSPPKGDVLTVTPRIHKMVARAGAGPASMS